MIGLFFVLAYYYCKDINKYDYYTHSHPEILNSHAKKFDNFNDYIDYMIRLEEHQKNYYCYICGKPSTPFENDNVTFWDQYTGLVECKKCKKFVCFDHVKFGYCLKCYPPEKRKNYLSDKLFKFFKL